MNAEQSIEKSTKLQYYFGLIANAREKAKPKMLLEYEQEYYDYLYSLENIKTNLEQAGLSKVYLKETVESLNNADGYRHIKGHILSYSTVAYEIPLTYFRMAKEKGLNIKEIVKILEEYWNDRINEMDLLRMVDYPLPIGVRILNSIFRFYTFVFSSIFKRYH